MGCEHSDLYEKYFRDWLTCDSSSDINGMFRTRAQTAWQTYMALIHTKYLSYNFPYGNYKQCTHPCFQQIAKDVTRTYPHEYYFGDIKNVNRFTQLLRKFALYFPKIGYTQGLNFLAGFLLISGYDDDTAFKVLVKLMLHEKILALGLYEDGFPLNEFYSYIFWFLLYKKIPSLYHKLKAASLRNENWLFKWFISFYLFPFPIELAHYFWDFIICKKEFALPLLALGIVRCLKNDLMNICETEECDFYYYFGELSKLQFCTYKLDFRKIVSFANSVSCAEIDEAIANTRCYNNIYRTFFDSSSEAAQQQLTNLVHRLYSYRQAFRTNPYPKKYQRSVYSMYHIEKLILSKYKLYQSDLRHREMNNYKKSSYSIYSMKSQVTNNRLNFCKRKY